MGANHRLAVLEVATVVCGLATALLVSVGGSHAATAPSKSAATATKTSYASIGIGACRDEVEPPKPEPTAAEGCSAPVSVDLASFSLADTH